MFAFLNVVVAVIVESVLKHAMASDAEALKNAEEELKNTLLALYETFRKMDVDGDMEVTRQEFFIGMEDQNVKLALSQVEISPQDAMHMFDILDIDDSGSLKMEEFIEGCVRARGPAKAKDVLALSLTSKKMSNQLDATANQIGNLEKSMMKMQEHFDDKFDQVMKMMAKISLVPENQKALSGLPTEWLCEEQPELLKIKPDAPREGVPEVSRKFEAPNTGVPTHHHQTQGAMKIPPVPVTQNEFQPILVDNLEGALSQSAIPPIGIQTSFPAGPENEDDVANLLKELDREVPSRFKKNNKTSHQN